MACEDFPCCGHEPGCCPDFDEAGRQLNMRCTCGAILPVNARYSICDTCLNRFDEEGERLDWEEEPNDEGWEDDYGDEREDFHLDSWGPW